MEDQHPSANNTTEIEGTEGEGDGHHRKYFDGRRIHRVPDLVRLNKDNEEDYYAPKMVSFGPHYHGVKELGMAEEFKREVLKMFVSSSGRSKQFFYWQIFEVIDEIRNCYAGVSRDAYDNQALAEMMLLDASFAIYLMENQSREAKYISKCVHFRQHLGLALLPFAFQDLCLLDNQIPLWVIELLTNLIYRNKEEGPKLICEFSNHSVLPHSVRISITGEDKKLPLHLVAAFHQLLVEEPANAREKPSSYCLKNINFKSKCRWWPWKRDCLKNINFKSKCRWWPQKKENPYEFGDYNRQSHSVTDLKAKGIHFKPSSYCLKNVEFKSYKFYGQLQLPVWIFTNHSKQFFLQMIAYEASPESYFGTPIICYVNFLKSLIVKSEDVKELREKKILFSSLDSDEEVVEVIKGINTCGLDYDFIFRDVKKRIEEHCSSKAKTWIAELINSNFRSPWTFIALVAATFLLCLTFLQTYYTMNSIK